MKMRKFWFGLLLLCVVQLAYLLLTTCHFRADKSACVEVNSARPTAVRPTHAPLARRSQYRSSEKVNRPRHTTARPTHAPVARRSQYRSTEIGQKIKTIQWYDHYHHGHGLRTRSKHVDFNRCDVKNCVLLPEYIVKLTGKTTQHILNADAVLIQYIHASGIQYPPTRQKDQVFVMAEREAIQTKHNQRSRSILFEDVFNWTMTYRHDSDIVLPYGRIVPRNNIPGKNFTNIFRMKSKEIVWLVSHCETFSKREKYVVELQKYINVDIYGKCGTFECIKTSPNLGTMDCIQTIVRDYKFHLSFENCYHRDYVTEKFFDWFNADIVQITMGAANYSNIAPHGSFINVADFPTPRHLAEYLNKLKYDEKSYTDMLKTKNKYYAEVEHDAQQGAYCRLCEMLNNVDKYRSTYRHIHAWWSDNSTRVDATQYLKNV